MNKQAFTKGFIKRAEEYGIPHSKAIDLIKQATIPDEAGRYLSRLYGNVFGGSAVPAITDGDSAMGNILLSTGLHGAGGALAGGGLGALTGAISGNKDEHGKSHRITGALKGGLLGGGLGGLGGAAFGAGAAFETDMDPTTYNEEALKQLLQNSGSHIKNLFH